MRSTTPFGDSPSVVRTMVISTRDTGVLSGVFASSTFAGLLLSSLGLTVDSMGLSLTFLPSGVKNVTVICCTFAPGVVSRGTSIDFTSAGLSNLTMMVGVLSSLPNDTPRWDVG